MFGRQQWRTESFNTEIKGIAGGWDRYLGMRLLFFTCWK